VRNADWQYPGESAERDVRAACGSANVDMFDAGTIATALMGDSIATNMFMLGYAWQKGWVPLSEAAIMKAVELNGVSIDFNKGSFNWGRMAAHDMAAVEKAARSNSTVAQVIEFKRTPSLDDVVSKRVSLLTAYQDAGYAAQYKQLVDQVREAEGKLGDAAKSMKLSEAVARYYYKLMAYKDEYEVARLHSDPAFKAKIDGMFEGDYKVKFHLAPPLLAKRDAKGHLIKQEFGPWMMRAFGVLAKFKSLRGGALDIFGYTAERKMERALIVEYRGRIQALLSKLTAENLSKALAIASIPEDIRGYGHVKERHLAAAKQKEARLLAEFDAAPVESKQVA
jgi:indolepyruvate ferredoxin oxidoreductase